MIRTVMLVSLRRLLHNRVELLLAFVVPLAFFSIFALIFGKGIGSGATPKIKVVFVDEAKSPDSRAVTTSLRDSGTLRIMRADSDQQLRRKQATRLVQSGNVSMAIVLQQAESGLHAQLLTDSSDQVAPQVVSALVGRSLSMTQMQNRIAARKIRQESLKKPIDAIEPPGDQIPGAQIPGDPTPGVRSTERSSEEVAPRARFTVPESRVIQSSFESELPKEATQSAPETIPESFSPVEIVDVIGEGKSNPVVSMYAAGIAVMFLLFGASGGGGALLEERENQTLDRLLSTQLSMDQLLLGKWFYLTALGIIQVCLMFAWGQLVFGIDVLGHLDGFLMMTIVTSGAAAAFGLFLATLCKTRGQLNGLSVILILSMSALGGSMVPRYVMTQSMRDAGLYTFNAWALDGYDKVFWRELPVDALWPQLCVLVLSGVAFLLLARLFAIRWERN